MLESTPNPITSALGRVMGGVGRWLPVVGSTVWLMGCKGRPYRLDGEAFTAAATPRSDWGLPLSLDARGCGDEFRAQLRDRWLESAAAEHGSIPSFARLAQQLLAVGAPPELVERAHSAALDEIRHARLCYSLASAYAGEDLGPSAFPEACVPERSAKWTREELLERLAVESLTDGALNEGFAAAEASAAHRRARLPAVAKVLGVIAADEREHAELAWAVLAWCVKQAPSLERRLRVEGAALPAGLEVGAPRSLAQQQRDHGLLTQGEREDLFARTRNDVLQRLNTLLSRRPSTLAG